MSIFVIHAAAATPKTSRRDFVLRLLPTMIERRDEGRRAAAARMLDAGATVGRKSKSTTTG
eukprot:scaffold192727_cov31-Tisochrysis_lutea.AAC.2